VVLPEYPRKPEARNPNDESMAAKPEFRIGHFPQFELQSSFEFRHSDFSSTFPLLLPGSGFIMAAI
jgi:hypothetical protein